MKRRVQVLNRVDPKRMTVLVKVEIQNLDHRLEAMAAEVGLTSHNFLLPTSNSSLARLPELQVTLSVQIRLLIATLADSLCRLTSMPKISTFLVNKCNRCNLPHRYVKLLPRSDQLERCLSHLKIWVTSLHG